MGEPGTAVVTAAQQCLPTDATRAQDRLLREDRLIRELTDRLSLDHEDIAGMVSTLRSPGSLITHNGTTWILTPA